MKKAILLIFGICIFGLSFSQHTYHDSKFKINFPGEPSEKEQDVETAVGPITMYSLMYEGYNSAYMLAYSDYPSSFIKDGNKADLLDNAKGGFIGSLGIEVTYERKISIKGHPGIYFKAEGSGYYCVMKDYLVNNRLYQIGILRADRFPTNKEIDDYINTFSLK